MKGFLDHFFSYDASLKRMAGVGTRCPDYHLGSRAVKRKKRGKGTSIEMSGFRKRIIPYSCKVAGRIKMVSCHFLFGGESDGERRSGMTLEEMARQVAARSVSGYVKGKPLSEEGLKG
ncbi:MAG: hypothetical protein V3U42_04205 [candidate division NC10 bacterium]|jgi:hypothetical protein|nr:hypothetical protein [candidate division NC10 bacterium]MCZ6550927.1 hypothetical protein [candidate division NC10 bacterium]